MRRTTMRSGRTWPWAKTRPWVERCSGAVLLSPSRSCPDCTTITSGYNFRKGQVYVVREPMHENDRRFRAGVVSDVDPVLVSLNKSLLVGHQSLRKESHITIALELRVRPLRAEGVILDGGRRVRDEHQPRRSGQRSCPIAPTLGTRRHTRGRACGIHRPIAPHPA